MPDKKSEEKRAFSAQLAMKIKVPVPFVYIEFLERIQELEGGGALPPPPPSVKKNATADCRAVFFSESGSRSAKNPDPIRKNPDPDP